MLQKMSLTQLLRRLPVANPEYFAANPIGEVLQTLVHEMVHLWQYHGYLVCTACFADGGFITAQKYGGRQVIIRDGCRGTGRCTKRGVGGASDVPSGVVTKEVGLTQAVDGDF